MDLDDQVEEIETKEDFANFLHAFRETLLRQPDEWENSTLERFLDAMEAWVHSMDGYAFNSGDVDVLRPSWKTFAKILSAASVYE
ncbi:hypothetical protein SAMN05660659_01454 [Pseudomonas sp. LAMO17WK12:I6]|jgi:hypothetical protein|uniref:DUF7660 family protein n=1 Tax=unclassified Pseudomonas TaxID=196821 RepID=UPI000BC37D10|nr:MULTISPECIES: hypothetical protein [unclassified Pseudomonas]SNY17140.1 hypothetical protein SAMN05660659_01454 [Pseudomonas sp. LAMO17WK12:I6]SNY21084.1 hypothetical protein SAMN05660455_01947 [Pseudomonas sp. LAMO17WK12:I5]